MLTNPVFTGFAEFATTGNKSAPGASLLSSGYLPQEILPAEQFNWLMNRASKGVTETETYVDNINKELNAVLVNLAATPSGATDQLSNKITAAATANTLMKRDAAGRAKVVAPSADDDIATKGYCIPVGFVYIQGPLDALPSSLWPGTTWTNVSSEEAGLFRRFEGGDASAFGGGTQASQNKSHLHSASSGTDSPDHVHNERGRIWDGGTPTTSGLGSASATSDSSSISYTDGASARHSHGISVAADGGVEARPVNITVRKWRRTA